MLDCILGIALLVQGVLELVGFMKQQSVFSFLLICELDRDQQRLFLRKKDSAWCNKSRQGVLGLERNYEELFGPEKRLVLIIGPVPLLFVLVYSFCFFKIFLDELLDFIDIKFVD